MSRLEAEAVRGPGLEEAPALLEAAAWTDELTDERVVSLDLALAALAAARHSGLEQALDLLEHPEHPRNDNTPAFWEGWHAALAAVRVALAAARPSGYVEDALRTLEDFTYPAGPAPTEQETAAERALETIRAALDGRREEGT